MSVTHLCHQVIEELDTTEEMVALTLSAYALAVGLCPLAWGPLSDRHGRRVVLIASLCIFVVSALLAGYGIRSEGVLLVS